MQYYIDHNCIILWCIKSFVSIPLEVEKKENALPFKSLFWKMSLQNPYPIYLNTSNRLYPLRLARAAVLSLSTHLYQIEGSFCATISLFCALWVKLKLPIDTAGGMHWGTFKYTALPRLLRPLTNRPTRFSICMYWKNIWQPTGLVQQNIFEKTLKEIDCSHFYASFGTFCVQIGQPFEAQWDFKLSE